MEIKKKHFLRLFGKKGKLYLVKKVHFLPLGWLSAASGWQGAVVFYGDAVYDYFSCIGFFSFFIFLKILYFHYKIFADYFINISNVNDLKADPWCVSMCLLPLNNLDRNPNWEIKFIDSELPRTVWKNSLKFENIFGWDF